MATSKLKQISVYYNGLGFISQMADTMYFDTIPCIYKMITKKDNGSMNGDDQRMMEKEVLSVFNSEIEDEKLLACKDLLAVLEKIKSYSYEVDVVLDAID